MLALVEMFRHKSKGKVAAAVCLVSRENDLSERVPSKITYGRLSACPVANQLCRGLRGVVVE